VLRVASTYCYAPINKRALFLVGTVFQAIDFSRLTGAEEYAMAFVAANLRIVLLSTHVPLSQAIRTTSVIV
jgi:4-hydroxy-L-threonine phosphate dehydrogenase PdxA